MGPFLLAKRQPFILSLLSVTPSPTSTSPTPTSPIPDVKHKCCSLMGQCIVSWHRLQPRHSAGGSEGGELKRWGQGRGRRGTPGGRGRPMGRAGDVAELVSTVVVIPTKDMTEVVSAAAVVVVEVVSAVVVTEVASTVAEGKVYRLLLT